MIAEFTAAVVLGLEQARSARQALDQHQNPPRIPTPPPPPPYDPEDSNGIESMIEFFRLSPERANQIREVLQKVHVADYRKVNEVDLPRQDLVQHGLSISSIALLYVGARKYRSFKTRERNASQSG